MKKNIILVLSFIFLIVLSSNAAAKNIRQGTLEISGDLQLSASSTEIEVGSAETDVDTQALNLSTLYYLWQNIGLGIHCDYDQTETNNFETTSSIIGPVIKYNQHLNKNLNFFISGKFGIAEYEAESLKADGYGWGIGAGINCFIIKNVALTFSGSFELKDMETDSGNIDIDERGTSLGIGLSVFL